MKDFIGACLLLLFLIVGISLASAGLCKASHSLLTMAEEIPLSEATDFEVKKAALQKLDAAFEDKHFVLSISVNRRNLSSISERLAIAKGYAEAEDSEEFAAAIYALREGLESLREDVGIRLQKII